MGFAPGTLITVVGATGNGSVVVALNEQRIGLDASMARQIQVIDAKVWQGISRGMNAKTIDARNMDINAADINASTDVAHGAANSVANSNATPIKLRDVSVGATGRVVGYNPAARSYKRKLLAMGLTPGIEFTVTRCAPLGDPIEIRVRGFQLSLRQDEADAMLVELA